MSLKKYQAFNIGDRQVRLRREDTIVNLSYFSTQAFERQEITHICGYTDLNAPKKKGKKEPDGILVRGNINIAYVYSERPPISTNMGYIKIDNTNEFVAITTRRYACLPIIFVLMILLLLLLPYCNKDTGSTPTTTPWNPVIEANLGEDETSNTQSANSQIQIAGFSSWHISAGESENLPITLENPEGNPCYFSFSIVLENGEKIYQSNMVPPGEAIKKITINRSLNAGVYPAIVHIDTNSLKDGKEMNKADLNINICVS